MSDLVVALDINGTIIDGDTFDPELLDSTSLTLTEPARELITELTKRISIDKQNIQVVVFTLGVDWPGIVKQIEDISGGVISFDRGTGLMYVGRSAGTDPPAVFVRQLVEDKSEKQPFEHDGIIYDGSNPKWRDPGPALSYETFRERISGKHLVIRAVYNSHNAAVVGREDKTLAAKLLVSQLPVIVFDDHPGDWEVISPKQKIVKAVSPANVTFKKGTTTNFCKELAQFVDSYF